jgi:hypothetical protein
VGEEADEPFRAIGGLAGVTGRHGDGDRPELALDRRREATVALPDERVEPCYRLVEPVDGGRAVAAPASVSVEPDHLTHVRERTPAV